MVKNKIIYEVEFDYQTVDCYWICGEIDHIEINSECPESHLNIIQEIMKLRYNKFKIVKLSTPPIKIEL